MQELTPKVRLLSLWGLFYLCIQDNYQVDGCPVFIYGNI